MSPNAVRRWNLLRRLTCIALCAAGLNVARAEEPAAINGVMLQAFYWDVPRTTPAGSWWKNLERKAGEFADVGFTGIWLPPPYKGGGGNNDVGYGVYDRYDLGEFNQKGTVATRYGTFAELKSAVVALKARKIQVYADVVMNHMMGADADDQFKYEGRDYKVPTRFAFTGRGNTYSNYKWQYYNFNGVELANHTWKEWKGGWDFPAYHDAWDNLMGCEIRFQDENNCRELIRWGHWFTDTLDLDGYRLDATKHIHTPFVNRWLDEVKGPRFAVSEAMFYDLDDLKKYSAATGGRTSLFDFPLHKVFAETLNSNGPGDLRKLRFAGFTEGNGPLSVSFVDNHDTDRDFSIHKQKMLAYAYVLMRDKGYPCVFYKDYYEYGLGPEIKQLMKIRREHAYGPSWEHEESDADVYAYSRAGNKDHTGLVLLLCDRGSGEKRVRTPFANARLTDLTGNQNGVVVTDASGVGAFPLKEHSYSVWSPKAMVPASAEAPRALRAAAARSMAASSMAAEVTATRQAFVATQDPLGEPVEKVVYLKQNWTPEESNRFYFTAQGSQLIPYDWFLALEQVNSTTLFRDNQNILKYRYLPQQPGPLNPDGLPVGFVADEGSDRTWLGLTCAACHTAEIRLGKIGYRVDGAPTHADVQGMLAGMIASMQQTQRDSTKFDRFAGKVLRENNTPRGKALLKAQLDASIQKRIGYNLRNFPTYDPSLTVPPEPTEYGRLDAVDAIVNEVFHLAVRDPDPANPTQESKPANAPVSYPFLWDTPQHDVVEWLGIAKSGGPLGIKSLSRNVGEVVGVFANVEVPDNPSLLSLGYRSTVNLDALNELEQLLQTLWSPKWPDDFPPIDTADATEGEELYRANCVDCHAIINRKDPNRKIKAEMADVKTDRQAHNNFFSRKGSSGKLKGVNINLLPFTPKMPATATADMMLTNTVAGTILGALKSPPPDELSEIEFHGPHEMAEARGVAPPAPYKARPLNGIWATAPYLHNGSVPTLHDLLQPAANRPKSFSIGVRTFDPVRVGYQTEVEGFPKFFVELQDGTPIPGNSNAGHEYGKDLKPQERSQLIEFLKTL